MVEIDHSNLPQNEPEPAIPILASHILLLEQKQRARFARDGRLERLSTHCEDVDEMLGGGVERGIVMGISSEGIEGRLISLHLLATILLSHLPLETKLDQEPKTKVTIIDTTGSFPLQFLAQVIKSRITTSHSLSTRTALQTANHSVSNTAPSNQRVRDEALIVKEVQQCLQMIAISRVFDIEGLWEVLGEIGHETPIAPSPGLNSPIPTPKERKSDGHIQFSPEWPEEINDSQEENEDDLTNDDYDIDVDVRPEITSPMEKENEGIEMVIIDNMSQIINELFSRKEKNDAHNLLTLLSRQIHTLSSTSNILTILHNTTTSSKPSSYPPNQTFQQRPQKQKPKSNPQPTSLFPSNPLKPALGSLFFQFPSLHILTSNLPKTREDAEVLYGQEEEGMGRERVRYCCVVEVLLDECPDNTFSHQEGRGKEGMRDSDRDQGNGLGHREQKWCAVELDTAGTGLKPTFEMRGGMKGMGLERRGIGRGIGGDVSAKGEGSTETEVGNVAKVWGFGGRRV